MAYFELSTRSLPQTPYPQSVHETPYEVYTAPFLLQQSRWIRDDLDNQIAKSGPDALHSDELLRLDEFLRRLLTSKLSATDLQYSRMHLAIMEIAGHATRWPRRLIDRCEALEDAWTRAFGPLKELGTLLYEPRGRLHGLCNPDDLSNEKLMIKWLKTPTIRMSPVVARRYGDLGFLPGSWWINPIFAFLDGIIDSGDADGGIASDANGAYAILMTNEDEIDSTRPETFTYRAKAHGRGRYKLTAGTPESRNPVRVLRSHSLRSFWSPRAGVRYDGLHKVVGWTIKQDRVTKHMTYDITFKRLASEPSMEAVLRRPWADEVEDNQEYKRQRQAARERQKEAVKLEKSKSMPIFASSVDGIVEVYEDETAEPPFYRHFDDTIPVEPNPEWAVRVPLGELAKQDIVAPAETSTWFE